MATEDSLSTDIAVSRRVILYCGIFLKTILLIALYGLVIWRDSAVSSEGVIAFLSGLAKAQIAKPVATPRPVKSQKNPALDRISFSYSSPM